MERGKERSEETKKRLRKEDWEAPPKVNLR